MSRPVFVAKSTDFQSINQDNFVQIMNELDAFYYHMMKKLGCYHEHRFRSSAYRFWVTCVWPRRENFDRSKARLTTWLGYVCLGWVTQERQAASYGVTEDEMSSYHRGVFNSPKERRKRFFLLPSGLNPAIIPDRKHGEIDTGAEKVTSVDSSFGKDIELRQLISLLSEEDRQLLELKELGHTLRAIAKILNIDHRKTWAMMKEAKAHLQELMDNKIDPAQRKSKWNLGSYMNKTYWDEWFRTRKLAFPITVMSQEALDKLPVFRR